MRKRKIKKFLKNNIFNLITQVVAIVSLLIVLFSFLNEKSVSNLNIYSDILIGDSTFDIDVYCIDERCFTATNPDTYNLKMSINNIGDGVAKNINLKWKDENRNIIRKYIKTLDNNNTIKIEDVYPIMKYQYDGSSGASNISDYIYREKVNFLFCEKEKESSSYIAIPNEYIIYIQMLTNLAFNNNLNIDDIFNDIHFYLDLEYRDIKNVTYNKTIIFDIKYKKVKTKLYDTYKISIEENSLI